MDVSGQFLWGAIGGVSLEILHWWVATRKNPDESFTRNPKYWGATVGMIVVSGWVAQAYFHDNEFSKTGAFHVGFTTPYLLQAIIRKAAGNVMAGAMNAGGPANSGWLKWLEW